MKGSIAFCTIQPVEDKLSSHDGPAPKAASSSESRIFVDADRAEVICGDFKHLDGDRIGGGAVRS